MIGFALALAASAAHVGWNAILKASKISGLSAMWAYSAAAVLLVAPIVITQTAVTGTPFTWLLVAVSAVSMILHLIYGAALQTAYVSFALTDLYPLSRGLAPVLVGIVSATIGGQVIPGLQWCAIVVMLLAGLMLAMDSRRRRVAAKAVWWSVGIALAVAAYTLWDGWVIVRLGQDPLAYYATGAVLQIVVLTALLRFRLRSSLEIARVHSRALIGLAVLIPASYLLALFANEFLPVAVVAALRSTSLVGSAVAGFIMLKERITATRVVAIGAAAAAIVLIAIPT